MDALGKALAAKAGKEIEIEVEPEDEGGDALDECCAAIAPDKDRGEMKSMLRSAILQVMNEK